MGVENAKTLSEIFALLKIKKRGNLMKVYISADIEGIVGIVNWDEATDGNLIIHRLLQK
jgi:hypothetical protein